MLDFKVIFKSIRHPDKNTHEDLKHDWINIQYGYSIPALNAQLKDQAFYRNT